jgi:competence protein ComEC
MINGKSNYWLNKIMPAKISSSLSICISAWLGSLPLTIYYFDSLSIISILLNLIFVPLLSLVFMIAFTFVIVSILLPFLASIIKLPAVLFGFLVKLLGYISNATIMFNISVEIVGVIMFYCAIILAGDYIFIKEKRKCILSCLFITGFIFSCIVSSLFV